MDCPKCGSGRTTILGTKRRVDGSRSRRHQCHDCLHRWTTIAPADVSFAGDSNLDRRRFSEGQIARILFKGEPAVKLAEEFGVRRESINRIRRGESYKDVHRKLLGAEAPGAALCTDCPHWYNGCDLSIPEAGGNFAAQCSVFQLLSPEQNDEEFHAAYPELAADSRKVRENALKLATP